MADLAGNINRTNELSNPHMWDSGVDRLGTIKCMAWELNDDRKDLGEDEAMRRHECRMTQRILFCDQPGDLNRDEFSREVVALANRWEVLNHESH